MLAVSDSGCGIDRDTQEHIFEPFFTTKGPGEGTGLGLANVYGIVKQHEGNIWVSSEPGAGTVFKVYLPSAGEKPVHVTNESDLVRYRKVASGTILLVEDDDSVRLFAKELLIDLGFTVIDTKHPSQAINIFSDNDIDLLVTDVIMPELNGPELYEVLQKDHPELKVLFMSGYTDNAVSRQIELKDGLHFIEKPFTVTDLACKVLALVDG
jgi:CheY-like chemotaxis protein